MAHSLGRFEKVRLLTPSGVSPSRILDRKWNTLGEYDWKRWCEDEGGLLPAVGGGVGWSGQQVPWVIIGWPDFPTGRTAVNLNSAYIAGVSGNAVGFRSIFPSDKTLTNIYFVVSSYTGTAANVNDLSIEIRSGTSSAPDTSAPGLLASATYDPLSASNWHNVSGFGVNLSTNIYCWLIIGDADGNGTDYASVANSVSLPSGHLISIKSAYGLTSNGFSSAPSIGSSALVQYGMKFSDNSIVSEYPFTESANYTATTQRGLYISGFNEQVKLYGLLQGPNNRTLNGAYVWQNNNGPSGSGYVALGTSPLVTSSQVAAPQRGIAFASPVTVPKNTPHRFTVTTSSSEAITSLRVLPSTSDMVNCMPGGGSWYFTRDNSGAWADVTNEYPAMALIVEDFPAIPQSAFAPPSRLSHPAMRVRDHR